MFTGIIEEIGIVKSLITSYPASRLSINAKIILIDIKIGDSISIDGVCLTVVKFDSNSFEVDVQQETINLTRISSYRPGTEVNLERAATPLTRLGGHYVQGHIDGTGIVRSWRRAGNDWVLQVSCPIDLNKYIVSKGFVTLNGISLTVTGKTGEIVSHIIPHTRDITNLRSISIGDKINIEVDVIAKYIEKFVK
ncbi:MAG: riboflavin synthase [Chlamydiae bacterium]|nr:MAG: riboflavin synthase [Chlamydiota bacterium]